VVQRNPTERVDDESRKVKRKVHIRNKLRVIVGMRAAIGEGRSPSGPLQQRQQHLGRTDEKIKANGFKAKGCDPYSATCQQN
jgi:hypothetical protein